MLLLTRKHIQATSIRATAIIINTTNRHPLEPDINSLHLKLQRFSNAGTPQAPACCSVDVHHGNLFAVGSLQFHHERTSLDGTPFKPCLSRKGKTLAPAVPIHYFAGKKAMETAANGLPFQVMRNLAGQNHRMLKAQSGPNSVACPEDRISGENSKASSCKGCWPMWPCRGPRRGHQDTPKAWRR